LATQDYGYLKGAVINMNRFLSSIAEYVKFFLIFLGLTYLSDELWNWFQGDSLLRNAVIATISFILVDLGRLLFKKFTLKKEESA